MKKTKIICTMGPASNTAEQMAKLIEAGMNVARFNFSHGSHEEHLERFKRLPVKKAALSTLRRAMLETRNKTAK